jgi:cytochrome c oxidase accessory protein FixG
MPSATRHASERLIMEPAYSEEHDTFRDALASVERDGRRRWIYARQPSGPLYRARTILSVFLLGFLFLAPFVSIHGQPLMLLNVLERHFVILGTVFRPQDFHIVVVLALAALVTLVLVTVTLGRVWCGWLCPQTIFMEMLFRRIEYAIEGSAEQQLRRLRGEWTAGRAVRKGLKHAVFFALSFAIANVFLAWIIGAPQLFSIITDPPSRHLAGLIAISLFSAVFYAVFARFREQACVLACPYGRVLSSLVDERTVTVTYDRTRGEPRSRLVRGAHEDHHTGDCIDCHRCVTVCPTGIDIRNGLQLECVACTACIDACNDVMRRVGRPEGLIRHASAQSVREGSRPRVGARVAAYGGVWVALVATGVFLLATRPDLDLVILRQPGTLYASVGNDEIANFYNVEALNRTNLPARFTIEVIEPRGATVTTLGAAPEIPANGVLDTRLLVRVPTSSIHAPSTPVTFVVRSNGRAVQQIDSAFLGPAQGAERQLP